MESCLGVDPRGTGKYKELEQTLNRTLYRKASHVEATYSNALTVNT